MKLAVCHKISSFFAGFPKAQILTDLVFVRLVGVEGAVMVLSVSVSAELLAVKLELGTLRN